MSVLVHRPDDPGGVNRHRNHVAGHAFLVGDLDQERVFPDLMDGAFASGVPGTHPQTEFDDIEFADHTIKDRRSGRLIAENLLEAQRRRSRASADRPRGL